jgi:hypothetical protein
MVLSADQIENINVLVCCIISIVSILWSWRDRAVVNVPHLTTLGLTLLYIVPTGLVEVFRQPH